LNLEFAASALICDFDGVVVDSEVPASRALAESLSAIGLPTSVEDVIRLYVGHNRQDTDRRIVEQLGRPIPSEFDAIRMERSKHWFAQGLSAVPGVSDFLDQLAHLPKAVASSSRASYIEWALGNIGLAHHFAGHIYSADGMARGKPHPDIYLKAAAGLGIDPEHCLAIEDSPIGASAAVAAGMHVVGLVAAGHIADRHAHAETLRAVGVHQIALTFADVGIRPA
jgi:HAD superfamily hydrolase (TIGR01509 family)